MTRRQVIARLMAGAAVGTGCKPAGTPATDPPAPAAPPRHPYGPDPAQFGELTLPAGAGPHPVLVAVHGGFWSAAYDLAHLRGFCAALAADGWAVWSVEYRRVGMDGGGWPNTLLDVGLAADHVRTLAPAHDLDLGRVTAVGHSAGGHLALWLAGRGRIPAGHPLHRPDPLPLKGAVSLAGVCDLRRGHERNLGNGAVGRLLGGGPGEVPERYAGASPSDLLPLGTPQVLVHGADDGLVPIDQSREYRAAAAAKGDAVELVELPGVGHFEVIAPGSPAWPAVTAALGRFR